MKKRLISLRAAATLVLAALVWAPAPRGVAQTEPSGAFLEIDVQTPRPLAAALEILEARHGLLLSYEDPAWSHPEDLEDVTEQVRLDLDRFSPGEAPRILVPRSGRLRLRYPITADGAVADPMALLESLLAAHEEQGNPGRFQVEQSGDRYLIYPREVRDATGAWRPAESALGTVISLANEERSVLDLFQGAFRQVRIAGGPEVNMGAAPASLLIDGRTSAGGTDDSARQILLRALADLDEMSQPTFRLAWQLLFDPRQETFYFNLHMPARREDPSRTYTPKV